MDPVDLRHLTAQTGGDTRLGREVLALFDADAGEQLAILARATPAERRAVAHRLLGSARAIGAVDIAREAAAIEAGGGDLGRLEAAVDAARAFIRDHLKSTR